MTTLTTTMPLDTPIGRIVLEGDGHSGCGATIAEDHDHPIYFGSVFPMIGTVAC